MGIFADILLSPAFQAFLAFIGHIHGPILALGAVLLIAVKGFKIFLGYIMNALDMLGGFSAKMKSAQRSFVTWRIEAKLASQAGLNFRDRLKQVSQAARDSRLLQLSRDAGVAKDRLAQLELQMLSNSRAATLYNDKTKTSIQYLNMNEAEALEMAVRYEKLAKEAGMAGREVKALNDQLLYNIQRAEGKVMTNQELLAGTSLDGGRYRAPYVGSGGGPAGGASGAGIVPGGIGRPGFMRTVGGLFRGANRGVGGAGIAGGIGMAATVGSSLVGLGTGITSQTGMAVQALAGVASMFGPTGMVVGGLLSIGSTIVDGIMAAEAERQKNIKEFRIVTANMSVENLNTVKGFASKAAAAGFVDSKAQAEFRATAFQSSANAMAGMTGLTPKQMQYNLNAFALSNKRAYDLAGVEANRTAILTAVGDLKKTSPDLASKDISGALGSLSAITAKTQDSVLAGLQETGLIAKGDKEALLATIKYNDKGQLTSDSFRKLLEAVVAAGKSSPVTTNRAGALPPSQNKDIQTTKFIPLSKNQMGPEFFGSTGNYTRQFEDFRSNFKLAPGTGDLAAQSVGDLFTNKKSGIKVLPNGTVQFADDTARSLAAVAVSGLAKSITGVSGGNITSETRTGRSFGYKTYSADEIARLKTTNPSLYNRIETSGTTVQQKGFNVAGQFFTQEMFDIALKKIKIKTPDGKTISAFDAGIGDKVINITKISTATQTASNNAIINAANSSAAVQANTFKTAGIDMKTSAADIGKAAAKFEGYGDLIKDSTNRAIAFAIISNTKAGRDAIDSGNSNTVNRLLNTELAKLGLGKVG
jgi:hypothetical protein